MHFQSILISLLATSVAARCHNSLSEKSQCREMNRLNHLIELASNTTKLGEVTNNNATKIAEIKAKASSATTKLQTLQSNATLVSFCTVFDAQAAEEDGCQETFMLQRFIKFAANTTAVAIATNNNATKIANIQTKASKAAVKLQTLTSNSTLQAACPAVQQKDECRVMNKLQKFVNFANNQTELDEITKGNTTEEAEIKTRAAAAQIKLTAFQGNATFMSACAAINSEKATESSTTTSVMSSGASIVKNTGVGFVGVSMILVVMLGMFVL